ncbi:NAD(P)H:quinone oxidoreductase [Roseivirga sp. BDSF3-8]|uniref:NAD(P)H:quinone oxidoreductase n=1 Tax=Roseivirga sp. BDSF3-8 TaxID=3241598 RepID=UPI0035326C4B
MSIKVAVIYYSATGTTYDIARAIEEGAKSTGAEVRFRRIAENAPQQAIESNEKWKEHLEATKDIPEASNDDLLWADAILFGTPTRYGLPTAQIKAFLDSTGPLWFEGKLVDKIVSSFTSASTAHGGHESTLLALNNTFYHWSSIIVSPGYADEIQFETGNPYGVSFRSNNGQLDPDDKTLRAAKFQGKRVAEVAAKFAG